MSDRWPWGLFEVTGIELEYMIVDRNSLETRPIADEVIHEVAGDYESEIPRGTLAWSNELALHVIELKTNGPTADLGGLADRFQVEVASINDILASRNARIMPTGMHPFMDPTRDFRVWPHEYNAVYEAFNRIFDCSGHGWANLQSCHINLPFSSDEEFGRLHAAIRLILPVLPALASSTPVVEGRVTGLTDSRLDVYRHNARRVPSVSGKVIPEPAFDEGSYNRQILEKIYADLAPHDPEGILKYEWANARGCIARFDRGSIEIRILDMQEAPVADLAVARTVIESVRALTEEKTIPLADQMTWGEDRLAEVFLATMREGEKALISDTAYLEALGCGPKAIPARDVWGRLIDSYAAGLGDEASRALEVILDEGTLATRIVSALGPSPSLDRIREVYGTLCDCAARGEMFHGA